MLEPAVVYELKSAALATFRVVGSNKSSQLANSIEDLYKSGVSSLSPHPTNDLMFAFTWIGHCL